MLIISTGPFHPIRSPMHHLAQDLEFCGFEAIIYQDYYHLSIRWLSDSSGSSCCKESFCFPLSRSVFLNFKCLWNIRRQHHTPPFSYIWWSYSLEIQNSNDFNAIVSRWIQHLLLIRMCRHFTTGSILSEFLDRSEFNAVLGEQGNVLRCAPRMHHSDAHEFPSWNQLRRLQIKIRVLCELFGGEPSDLFRPFADLRPARQSYSLSFRCTPSTDYILAISHDLHEPHISSPLGLPPSP
jgi:hypothetical protein